MASKRPDSDVWNIVDNDEMSQHYGRNFKFDFSYISSDEIKELFKDYVWQNYRVGNKTLSSLYREVNSYFYRFIQFAESRNINVNIKMYIFDHLRMYIFAILPLDRYIFLSDKIFL